MLVTKTRKLDQTPPLLSSQAPKVPQSVRYIHSRSSPSQSSTASPQVKGQVKGYQVKGYGPQITPDHTFQLARYRFILCRSPTNRPQSHYRGG